MTPHLAIFVENKKVILADFVFKVLLREMWGGCGGKLD